MVALIFPARRQGGSLLENLDIAHEISEMAPYPVKLRILTPVPDQISRIIQTHPCRHLDWLIVPTQLRLAHEELGTEERKILRRLISDLMITDRVVLAHDSFIPLAHDYPGELDCILHGTPSHSLDQLSEYYRRFWIEGLGKLRTIVSVSPHLVPHDTVDYVHLPTVGGASIDCTPKSPKTRDIDILHITSELDAKNPTLAWNALNYLRDEYRGLRTAVITTGRSFDWRPVADSVYRTVPYSTSRSLIARSKFLLVSSRAEGCPRVVFESLASDCVPIVSEESNRSRVVTNGCNGWVYQTLSVHGISQSMRSAYEYELQGLSGSLSKWRRIRKTSLTYLVKEWK